MSGRPFSLQSSRDVQWYTRFSRGTKSNLLRIVPETLPQYTGVSGDVGEKYFQLTSWIEEESCQNIRPTFYHELLTWASLDMEEQCLKPSGEIGSSSSNFNKSLYLSLLKNKQFIWFEERKCYLPAHLQNGVTSLR